MTQQERQVNELVKRLSPQLAAAFREAIAKHSKAIDIKALISALEVGDITRAAELVRIPPATLFPFTEALRNAFIQGGVSVATRGAFGFDGRHPQAESWFQSHAMRLVQGISAESVDVARQVIASQVGTTPPAKIAQEIVGKRLGSGRTGGMVGLTSQVADSILRGRESLRVGRYGDYLALKLRDKRFDRIIKAAARSGSRLTEAQINAILTAHKQKALSYRGKLIALNETNTALAAGRHESYRQMIESGVAENVTKRWQHNLSVEPRVEHLAMDGTVLDFDEPFVFSDAAMQFPHDPVGGAKHSIGCRCICVYRLVLPKG